MPPPGTMPSSLADLTASSASSTRCFFSIISTSVAAPTLIIATPLANLVILSWISSASRTTSDCSKTALRVSILLSISSKSPLPPTIIVSFLLMKALWASPKCSSLAFLSLIELLMYVAFVAMQRSINIFFLSSPYLGALTATTFIVPRIEFIIKAAKACPSISGDTITSGLDSLATTSSMGSRSVKLSTFSSDTRIRGSSCLAEADLSSVINAVAA